jgi:hypothetical protein
VVALAQRLLYAGDMTTDARSLVPGRRYQVTDSDGDPYYTAEFVNVDASTGDLEFDCHGMLVTPGTMSDYAAGSILVHEISGNPSGV